MTYIVVVCTGNVARSPALACLLQASRPDILVESAGVGDKAQTGLKMKRPMRELLTRAGYETYAQAHRSRRWADLERRPDAVVAVTGLHASKIARLEPGVHCLTCDPQIKDPAFGGQDLYALAWQQILENAGHLTVML